MSKNKITTLSYFLKRLRDSGYRANKIFNSYPANDIRKWTIMINPESDCVYVTCLLDSLSYDKFVFKLSDDGQNIKGASLTVDTLSMEVFLTALTTRGIIGNEQKA